MADLFSMSSLEQREVERQLALSAVKYPLYTMQVAGWLPARIILNKTVREFWEMAQAEIQPSMTDEQADVAITKAVLATGLGKEVDLLTLQSIEPMPQSLAQEVTRRHYITAVASRLGKIYQAIQDSDDIEIRRIITEISQATPIGTSNALTSGEVADLFEKVVLSGNRVIPSLIPGLDRAIGGFERQTETIIMARPSMGKTALMWQMARNMAVAGHMVLFYSLEMSAASMWGRAACPAAGIEWQDVKSDKITDEQRERLFRESRELQKLYGEKLRIDDRVNQTTETIWQDCIGLRPDVVFVDHLRLVKDRYGDNENKRQGYISQRLREIAKSCNNALILAAQLNRSVEDRKDKVPLLSDLRDCGEIEENADLVIGLYRDDYYNPSPFQTVLHPTEAWVRKYRDGPMNRMIQLVYNTTLQWFESPDNTGRIGPGV